MSSLLLSGNAYGLVTARSGARLRPAQVELLDPGLVAVQVNPDGRIIYRYRGREVDRDDVWHVRAYVRPGQVEGMSPIRYAAETVALGLAAERFANQFYSDGATPTLLLTTDQNIGPDPAAEAKNTLQARTRGDRGPLVLGHGLTPHQISVNPDDAMFLDSQRFTVSQIARVFGVAPELIGGDTGGSKTYANIQGRAVDFLRYSVQPWLVRLETALGELLPRGQYVRFNTGGLLRTTTKERYDAYKVALDAGFMTVDEVRQLEDLPALEVA
jgi:HK97 family phage portal protein